MAATAVFVVLVRLVGGPSEGDASESLYSTWAIAHGHFACAYPPVATSGITSFARPFTFIAPLWPLFSGGIAAVAGIGHNVPFPSQTALGPHCSTGLAAMYRWSVRSGAPAASVRIGYLGWLFLMGGAVALLRAVGRGRRVWEPVVVVLMACIPLVWMPVEQYFHPQDLLAMGLSLGGLACARRGWWVWAGVLVGLAVTSQQFALLVLAPLVVVVPEHRRVRFVGSAIGAAALVVVPVLVATSGRALRATVLGSGNTRSFGGTVLWELHLHGALLVIASRILPIVLAMAVAWWALRRLGPAVLESEPLVALIATSLSLRLAFEQNLFGYYFMALAVSLVLLDVVRGRIRGELVAWLALVVLVLSPVPWGFVSNSVAWGLQEREFLPFIAIAVAIGLIVHDARHGRVRRYLIAWLAVVLVAFARVPWTDPRFRHALPTWFWQIVLVTSGVTLALRPLLSVMRSRPGAPPVHTAPDGLSDVRSEVEERI